MIFDAIFPAIVLTLISLGGGLLAFGIAGLFTALILDRWQR